MRRSHGCRDNPIRESQTREETVMAFETKTPMALYKANLELVLRLGTLLHENRQRWMSTTAENAGNAIQKSLAETERMLTSNDWTSLAALPGESFWKSLQGQATPLQGTMENAAREQAAFAQGLKQAFEAWQQQCADALQGAPGTGGTLEDFIKHFSPDETSEKAQPKSKASPAASKPKKR